MSKIKAIIVFGGFAMISILAGLCYAHLSSLPASDQCICSETVKARAERMGLTHKWALGPMTKESRYDWQKEEYAKMLKWHYEHDPRP